MLRRSASLVAIWFATCGLFSGAAHAQSASIETFLSEGRLADGVAEMETALKKNPDDQQARFSLGVTQFFQAVEKLGQDQFRYGLLGNRRRSIPFMRLPIGENETPEQLSYLKARAIIQTFIDGLTVAEKTLAATKTANVKLRLKVGEVRLDLDGNGDLTENESLWQILQGINGRPANNTDAEVADLAIAFDDADVVWLRGYCHVMSAMGEMILAYDWKDQFERTAHLFYPDVESPYSYLQGEGVGPFNGFNTQNILDVIALIHTINYECVEPARMKTALAHMESVISLSRDSWKLINAETDNDQEWIPNANQTAAIGGLRVSVQMQAQWNEFLDEADAILQGKKLLPFWRGIEGGAFLFDRNFPANPELGINLRKVFTEPTRLDLMLWLHGSGLHPFLEKGEQTDPETWRRIMTTFQGDFFLFMAWFN